MMLDSGVHVDVQNMTITTDFLLLHLRKGGSLVMIELKVCFTISFNCKVFLFSLRKENFSDASYIMTDGTLQEAYLPIYIRHCLRKTLLGDFNDNDKHLTTESIYNL